MIELIGCYAIVFIWIIMGIIVVLAVVDDIKWNKKQ